MTERHPSVADALAEVEKVEDPGRRLRWKIRILVQHYAEHRQENYDIFMASWSVVWQLGGRPGLTLADRMFLVSGAMATVQELLAHDPTDEELIESMGYCEELHHRVANAIANAEQIESASRDFEVWSEELEKKE